MLTLRGVICLYQGEEIGMTDHPAIPEPPHDRFGRDPFRTPMQWSPGPDGGFTSGVPWLPLNDTADTNVASQIDDPRSMLALYRRLIGLRRTSAALRHGRLTVHTKQPNGIVAYERLTDRERILVLGNMGDKPSPISSVTGRGRILAATTKRSRAVQIEQLSLAPLEGLVLRMD
jgi:alpha-glucosidase